MTVRVIIDTNIWMHLSTREYDRSFLIPPRSQAVDRFICTSLMALITLGAIGTVPVELQDGRSRCINQWEWLGCVSVA